MRNYYKRIDWMRGIACLAILLYHLDIIKGGYLAVCTFFALSGYLSCISAFHKEAFSLCSYYRNRLLKLYLPLVIVVFITIAILSLFSNIVLLQLKSEVASILFGYNNFWQLHANLDYFARHANSPFLHLWYIAILLQFDLIFPFLYLAFRKLGDRFNRGLSLALLMGITILFTIYFLYASETQNIMVTYYHTFTRVFSLLFGVSLGFLHSYYGSFLLPSYKGKSLSNIVFYTYLLILAVFFIAVDANAPYFAISMVLVTLISGRLLAYAMGDETGNVTLWDKGMKMVSSISYEIYLVQYPVIFFFQYIDMQAYAKLVVMVLLIVVLSYLLHCCIRVKHLQGKEKHGIYALRIAVFCFFFYGAIQCGLAKDYTAEMEQLKEQLSQNEEMMQEKQKEYATQLAKEEADRASLLEDLEKGEENIKEVVAQLPVVGIGDSVMLGAVDNLYQAFPNGYFDAKVSRTAWVANALLQDLYQKNMLQGPIVINLGANGDCPESCKIEIMNTCEGHEVFWLNVVNDQTVGFNDKLTQLAAQYDNLHVVDWYAVSDGHPEYFVADGIHLTDIGREMYTKTIYDSLCQFYLKEYREKKEALLKEQENDRTNKATFYGNDLLINAFAELQEHFADDCFITNQEWTYSQVKEQLKKAIDESTLTHEVVFAFDHQMAMGLQEYQELLELCKDYEVYIVSVEESHPLKDLSDEHVTIIDFYEELQAHDTYLMADGIHLTKEGNQALSHCLHQVIHADH